MDMGFLMLEVEVDAMVASLRVRLGIIIMVINRVFWTENKGIGIRCWWLVSERGSTTPLSSPTEVF